MRILGKNTKGCGALRAVPLFFALCLASPALAQSTVELESYGVLCAVEFEGEREAPDTVSGTMNLIAENREIDVVTTRVPARIGLSFGFRVMRPRGTGADMARIVVTHPPLGDEGATRQSWITALGDTRPSPHLFTFEHEYELVEGRWTFGVYDGDRLSFELTFEVVGPWEAPDVTDTCYGPKNTS